MPKFVDFFFLQIIKFEKNIFFFVLSLISVQKFKQKTKSYFPLIHVIVFPNDFLNNTLSET